MQKIGAYLPRWPELPLETRMNYYREAGFTAICLHENGMRGDDPEHPTYAMAEKYGFDIQNVHLSAKGTNKMWLDCLDGEEVMHRYCREIKESKAHGVNIGIVHVTYGSHEITPPVTQIGVDRFLRIEEAAARYGFTVAIENSVSAEHVHTVIGAYNGSKNFGHCFDSGHWYCYTPEADFLADYGDILIATHLNDNEGINDAHLLPLDGIAPWERIKKQLCATAFAKDYIIVEPVGIVHRKYPGMSAEQIREKLKNVAIVNDEHLITIRDGEMVAYDKLSYPEYLERMYKAAAYVGEDAR